ncbi:hypothetical protein [Nonomuraea sp. NPDC049129]|uniref:hypothetical protein n=1 Tax=Nonomuraea sp. NPDC049129 TaxID=3155272 RepID=UPI00340C20F8
MSVLVCVSCRLAEGHLETCEGGGYADRDELAMERRAERTHEHDHWRLDERVQGCDYCLLDPPSFSVRVSDTGRRELAEACERYRQRVTTLEQYDAERAAIIAAYPA